MTGEPAHDHPSAGLMPVEEARERVLSRIQPLPPVELPLGDAYGCVLAEDAVAEESIPPFTSSAMDGFAVRAGDVAGAGRATPVSLRIVGRVTMGRAPDVEVVPGTAAEIATGGPIPAGADCVIPIEECGFEEGRLLVFEPGAPGRFVRPAGQDVGPGERLVPRGTRLGAPELGLLATSGAARVRVHPRVRVAVLSTGDELVEPGAPSGPGRVYDANSFILLGALREAGALPAPRGIVPDDRDRLLRAVEAALPEADAVVATAGVSMGERDPVKGAFAGRGDVEFVRVAMQPGMPQAFGAVEGRPFFGLPGNPVSVFVSFEVFVRPALLKMMGRRRLERPEVSARLETDLEGLPDKTRFARVRVRRGDGGWSAASTGAYQSNLMATVTRANGLAIIPPGTGRIAAGEPCRVLLFREPEE